MKLFFLFLFLSLPIAYGQTYNQNEFEPLPQEQIGEDIHEEDIELQEDVLHPEGEINDWSLGSEDLPAEDFEQ